MANDQFWRNEYPCECGAKFVVELPSFATALGMDIFDMECSFCKRHKSVTLPAGEIKYFCVAPEQNQESHGSMQN